MMLPHITPSRIGYHAYLDVCVIQILIVEQLTLSTNFHPIVISGACADPPLSLCCLPYYFCTLTPMSLLLYSSWRPPYIDDVLLYSPSRPPYIDDGVTILCCIELHCAALHNAHLGLSPRNHNFRYQCDDRFE